MKGSPGGSPSTLQKGLRHWDFGFELEFIGIWRLGIGGSARERFRVRGRGRGREPVGVGVGEAVVRFRGRFPSRAAEPRRGEAGEVPHQVPELVGAQGLAPVAPGLLGLGMHLDEEPICTCSYGCLCYRWNQGIVTGSMTGIYD